MTRFETKIDKRFYEVVDRFRAIERGLWFVASQMMPKEPPASGAASADSVGFRTLSEIPSPPEDEIPHDAFEHQIDKHIYRLELRATMIERALENLGIKPIEW